MNIVDDAVDFLLCDLERVAFGDDVAYNASYAISRLQLNSSNPEALRLDSRQRDRILSTFTQARLNILDLFSHSSERPHVDMCLDAVAGLICLWAESDAERAARHPHVSLDLHDYARQLRNALHNRSLRDDIDRRRAERVGDTVDGLLQKAVLHNH